MKLFLLFSILIQLISFPTAKAISPHGMAGCGPGSVLFQRTQPQMFAATTNGSSGLRYSAISSGTSNCTVSDGRAKNLEQEAFFFENYNQLAKELAQGGGPTSAVLAELLGCSKEELTVFNSLLQRDYRTILASPGAIASLESLKLTLQSDNRLSAECRYAHTNRLPEGIQ